MSFLQKYTLNQDAENFLCTALDDSKLLKSKFMIKIWILISKLLVKNRQVCKILFAINYFKINNMQLIR